MRRACFVIACIILCIFKLSVTGLRNELLHWSNQIRDSVSWILMTHWCSICEGWGGSCRMREGRARTGTRLRTSLLRFIFGKMEREWCLCAALYQHLIACWFYCDQKPKMTDIVISGVTQLNHCCDFWRLAWREKTVRRNKEVVKPKSVKIIPENSCTPTQIWAFCLCLSHLMNVNRAWPLAVFWCVRF